MASKDLTQFQVEALAVLTSSSDRLESSLAGLSEEQLDYSPAAEEWTIRQIVHHLFDGTVMWAALFNQAIGGYGGTIRFEAKFPGNTAWAMSLEFDKRPIEIAAALVKSHHDFIAKTATHFSDRWDWWIAIAGSDAAEGKKYSVGQIITMLGEHVAEHVATIEGIKSGLGM